MKKYFYSNGHEEEGSLTFDEGPLTLEELKRKNINPKTLIWEQGLDDWKNAEDVDELSDFFDLSHTPIDTENVASEFIVSKELETENHTATTNYYSKIKQEMFSKPFSFKGRIRRKEFCISFIISLFLYASFESLSNPFASLFFLILMQWFLWAQSAKRCHDLGKSGWWQIIPFYLFWLIFAKGFKGRNQYGRNPKFLIVVKNRIVSSNTKVDNTSLDDKIKNKKSYFDEAMYYLLLILGSIVVILTIYAIFNMF